MVALARTEFIVKLYLMSFRSWDRNGNRAGPPSQSVSIRARSADAHQYVDALVVMAGSFVSSLRIVAWYGDRTTMVTDSSRHEYMSPGKVECNMASCWILLALSPGLSGPGDVNSVHPSVVVSSNAASCRNSCNSRACLMMKGIHLCRDVAGLVISCILRSLRMLANGKAPYPTMRE